MIAWQRYDIVPPKVECALGERDGVAAPLPHGICARTRQSQYEEDERRAGVVL